MNNTFRHYVVRTLAGCMGGLVLGAPAITQASNGLYTDGQGLKSVTMGGAAIALPQDSMAAASNPAGMAYVGNRVDGDIQLFIGSNEATYGSPDNRLRGHKTVPIPEFGFNYDLSPKLSVGVSSIGAGVGWDYDGPLFQNQGLPRFQAMLKQVGVAPTLAYKVTDNFSVGVSITAAYQSLFVRGAALPTPAGPAILPNHGTQGAWSYGVRLGALWTPIAPLTLGVSYISKQKASSFDGYKDDLLAVSDGKLDSPEILGAGLAWRPTDKLTVAFDYRLIRWSEVEALNSDQTFGWRDQHNMRLGLAYQLNDQWTVRTGINYANRQYASDSLVANILIPGLLHKSYSAGVTRTIGDSGEATFGLVKDISEHVTGTGKSSGSTIDVKYGYVVMGYGYKF
ncbi:OmpP1/FadL family transporter [Pseudomonas sp. Q11]|uniref:OmpP1/FadL family transporter n=1 Tax=Pseudomonas sp. Q11 TaxID=2968470 RepID=UPI00210BB5E3|nr:outer membrane protein transport protein [Pseudomonas sp. Q11]MCQ6255308.1 outer membrane protein transport protein [Pseudomonas sp. Q11]